MAYRRGGSDAVHVGLISGAGIIAGAVMGAVTMFGLLERDKRRAAAARALPVIDTPPAAPAPIQAPPSASPPHPSVVGWDERGAYYIVQPGDYGAKIAALFPGADVHSLVKANPDIREWRSVQPGTRLRLPSEWTSTKPPGRSHALSDL